MFNRIKEFFRKKSEEKKLQEQRADELTEFFNSHRAQIKRLDEVRKKYKKIIHFLVVYDIVFPRYKFNPVFTVL